MIHIYGIPTCSSVRKAIQWAQERALPYEFHNFRKEALAENTLDAWLQQVPWTVLLNRKGQLWRKLDESVRASITDEASARNLMLENPVLIKRPVMVFDDGTVTIGVAESTWSDIC